MPSGFLQRMALTSLDHRESYFQLPRMDGLDCARPPGILLPTSNFLERMVSTPLEHRESYFRLPASDSQLPAISPFPETH